MLASSESSPLVLGRYALYGEIATGGMATVYYGRLAGSAGFSRTVAIKRMHPQFAKDPQFVEMFLDEARLAGRIRHPNVVPTLDVIALDGEVFLVMEYVQGESLSHLLQNVTARDERIPLDIASAIMCGALHGLHAAHEATDERGNPLQVVHRDVSPQNILVGSDGASRVLDFGIAKAAGHSHHTREGQLKGKLAYMSPEQLFGEQLDRRADVWAAGVVLWELLTLRRLFKQDDDNAGSVLNNVINRPIPPPGTLNPDLPVKLDSIVLRALERDREKRFGSALELALALEECVPTAGALKVGAWVKGLAGDLLAERAKTVSDIESVSLESVLEDRTVAHGRPSQDTLSTSTNGTGSQVSSTMLVATLRRPPHGGAFGAQRILVALGVLGGFVAAVAVFTILLVHRGSTHPAATVAPGTTPPTAPASAPAASPVGALAKSTHQGAKTGSGSLQPAVARAFGGRAGAAAASAVVRATPPSGSASSLGITPPPSASAKNGNVGTTAAPPAPTHRTVRHAVRHKPKCWIRTRTDSSGIEHFDRVCR